MTSGDGDTSLLEVSPQGWILGFEHHIYFATRIRAVVGKGIGSAGSGEGLGGCGGVLCDGKGTDLIVMCDFVMLWYVRSILNTV